MKGDDRRPAVSNVVFAIAATVLIVVAAAGFDLYATQGPAAVTESSTTTATVTAATLVLLSTVTTTSTDTGPYTVNIAYAPGTGFYLTNATGFTLYFLSTDPGNGTSTCTGKCVTFWPLFYAGPGPFNLPPGLSVSSFGVATRSDGKLQTTYNGYPLYYDPNDKAPGQITGQGDHNFYPCCSLDVDNTTTTTA